MGQHQSVATDLFAAYGPVEQSCHDEVFGPDGRPRAHWRGLIDWLQSAGAAGYQDSAQELRRIRNESGIAFTSGAAAATDADALPVVIAPDDWAELERGVLQRARLAEAALADVYGPGRSLATGLMPPGLVYGGPAFAAHCAKWQHPPSRWLHVYEADVARDADGNWILLADRMDAPLGDGYLLANRIAFNQALAEPFIDMQVRRLASHYADFQSYLEQTMGWEGRLTLLTGGEKDPRFFSHAYFARYLSAALVEPADLTVRDGSAYIKTLGGLKRTDLLLRGVSDAQIDSLHRPRQALPGAPALSLAARSGSLVVANALGSAVLSYRALAPYAHRLSDFLLGESLLLPDAPCLWLGGARARAQVLREHDAWRIERLTRDPGGSRNWEQEEHADDPLADRIARIGERLVAVRTPPLSRTAVWRGGRIVPTEWMMRVFASRTPDGWQLAPGGVAAALRPGEAPPALGFGKDVWVLPGKEAAPDKVPSLLTRAEADGHLRRTGRDLLSRVADEVFWIGRNAERAESTLRILNLCLVRFLAANRIDAAPAVLYRLAEIHALPNDALSGRERFRDAVRRLVTSEEEPWGLRTTLRALRAGAIRGRASISEESWRYIDRVCSDPRWGSEVDLRRPTALARLIEDALQALAALAGSAQENLTRNFAWRFLEMGRRIERGYGIAQVARAILGQPLENEETYLRAWLTLADSASAYRNRYLMAPKAAAVIDLLVLDESNPRSLAFQTAQLERVLSDLPSEIPYRRPDHRRALSLLTDIRMVDPDTLAAPDETGQRPELVALTDRCHTDLSAVSDLISKAFFAHSETPEALVSLGRFEDHP